MTSPGQNSTRSQRSWTPAILPPQNATVTSVARLGHPSRPYYSAIRPRLNDWGVLPSPNTPLATMATTAPPTSPDKGQPLLSPPDRPSFGFSRQRGSTTSGWSLSGEIELQIELSRKREGEEEGMAGKLGSIVRRAIHGHKYPMSTDSASSPMPVDLPPVSKVYQDQMTTLSHGLALWNPNPLKEIYDKVSIGDVGYLHEGSFIRMFNVMLPSSHPSNRTLGEPASYESLDCGPFTNTVKRRFDSVKHCSRYVSAETNTGNRQAMTSDNMEGVTYKFRNCGALLSLPNGGHHEDVIRTQVFEDYIQAHVDSWFTWAQKNRLGVERVGDLILVSGCTLVTSWAAAAFVDDTMDAEVSLASKTFNNGGASFVWSNIRGRVFYHNSRFEPVRSPGYIWSAFHGEKDSIMTRDQCVFIRGFRVKDDNMQVIRVPCVPKHDDPNIGLVDAIRPSIKNENPQRSPYRRSTVQRNDSVSHTSSTAGPGSRLDTFGPLINRENPSLLPYSSSTAVQSNGDLCNASFTTSPSDNSLFEVPNDIADHAIIDQATTTDMRAMRMDDPHSSGARYTSWA